RNMSAVTITQQLNASLDKVWDAITQPTQMKIWFFNVHQHDLKVGNVFTFYGNEKEKTYLHRCEILKIMPQAELEHTWEHPDKSDGKSVLHWQLTKIDDETTSLTITHSGLESFADAGPEFAPEHYEFGWKGIIYISLRNYLHHIEKQVWTIDIKASRDKVWYKIWDNDYYTQWSSVFSEGSYYQGTLAVGNRIHFLSPG